MGMNSRGVLCVPGCTTVALRTLRARFTGCRTLVSFPVRGRVVDSHSVAPEQAGKVSEGGKPCKPAKTTRKTML